MQKKPHILITNDDGVNAPGIQHLWEYLQDIADLTVVAPLMEQSSTSLSSTIRSPLMIEKSEWKNGVKVWSVNGTPSDCVKLGMSVILNSKPDLVVSGINRGSNAGRTALYSGTVAGAIEGVLHGLQAIAFSCCDYSDTDYTSTKGHIPGIVRHILEHPLPEGSLLNVNFPGKESAVIKGYKLTRQGKEFWGSDPTERLHPAEGHSYYWLGSKVTRFEEEEDCDVSWLGQGYVTAVPLRISELTDHVHLQNHRARFESIFK